MSGLRDSLVAVGHGARSALSGHRTELVRVSVLPLRELGVRQGL